MDTIQIRIDEKTKHDARNILEKLGLDLSTAIKIFLKQVKVRKGLPFQVLTENGLTLAEEAQILKASNEARRGKNISKPMEGEEVINFLRRL